MRNQSYTIYWQGAMLAPIRLTNAAAQLPCGSGETQGGASPLVNVPRTFLARPHLPRPYAV